MPIVILLFPSVKTTNIYYANGQQRQMRSPQTYSVVSMDVDGSVRSNDRYKDGDRLLDNVCAECSCASNESESESRYQRRAQD